MTNVPVSRFALACLFLYAFIALAACSKLDESPDSIADATVADTERRFGPVLAKTRFGAEVARAVREHPVVASGTARLRSAEAQLLGARAAQRPRVSIGLDLQTALLGSATQSSYLPVLQVSQLLFDGGQSRARVDAARLGIAGEFHALKTSAAQLTLAAVEAWHETGYRRQLSRLMDQSVLDHRLALTKIEDRLAAGAATESDVLIARSRLADAIARHATARGDEDRALAVFYEIFGRSPSTSLPIVSAPELPAQPEATLLALSPRLLRLKTEIEVAEEVLAAVDAARWPTVDVTLIGQHDPEQDRSTARLQSSPRSEVLTGGARAADQLEAAARVEELRAEYTQLERQIIRSLANLRSDRRVGAERLEAAKAAVSANEASVEAIEEQFNAGRATILQVLDARREAVTSEQALLQAERDLALSGYAALALTGDILDVFGVDLVAENDLPSGARGLEKQQPDNNLSP